MKKLLRRSRVTARKMGKPVTTLMRVSHGDIVMLFNVVFVGNAVLLGAWVEVSVRSVLVASCFAWY